MSASRNCPKPTLRANTADSRHERIARLFLPHLVPSLQKDSSHLRMPCSSPFGKGEVYPGLAHPPSGAIRCPVQMLHSVEIQVGTSSTAGTLQSRMHLNIVFVVGLWCMSTAGGYSPCSLHALCTSHCLMRHSTGPHANASILAADRIARHELFHHAAPDPPNAQAASLAFRSVPSGLCTSPSSIKSEASLNLGSSLAICITGLPDAELSDRPACWGSCSNWGS